MTQHDWIYLQAFYAMQDKKSPLYNKILDDEAREVAATIPDDE